MALKKGIYAEHKAEEFLSKYLPVAKSILTKKLPEALSFLEKQKLSYPVVLKLISKDALHKTDLGFVKIVNNEDELNKNFDSFLAIAKKKKLKTEGILVQEFIVGKELIVGIKNDKTFGHVIALGIGGTLVEVLKDITFRVCPINESDAQQMIDELKASKILYGVRGEKSVNIQELKQILVKTSQLAEKNKNLEELDINPLIINDKLAKVADARIVVS
jgi:succinyl-CoA synthetase beta subunit